ncbi:MAG: aminoacetone oxidase family FAD-binding enzyme [Clostridiales bacterium]|nr:aminoacetone oxidase family FAD-binding enzyme [Clostridiales bacterium]
MRTSGPEVLVVGGGPAGMAAALYAKGRGAEVLLLEQNEKLGKKLYITGKGRCNVTNQASQEDFLANVPRNPRFLYAALSFLSPEGLRAWLLNLGCETVVERGQRVFPRNQKSSDVIKALSRGLLPHELRLNCQVAQITAQAGQVTGVRLQDGSHIPASKVVLATGGVSYPVTGSRGEGHRMARELGHEVSELLPALVGLSAADAWLLEVQGLGLKNVALHAAVDGKTRFSQQGELLFTHTGISGPLTLSLSSVLAGADWPLVDAWLDLKPALNRETLLIRLNRDISQKGRRQLMSLMPEYLPASLARVFPGICGLDGSQQLNQLTAAQRAQLTATMKRLPLSLSGTGPFSQAVITRGGVSVKDISPSTMASKQIEGLYFAGEIIDVDALTGGFNLHIAFATGALAGAKAAASTQNDR